uniref:Protein transport protein Sec61 subunit gamma n=14 Tax=Protacanthopterygii TaxID=41705 RepID=A0A4W5M0Y8_9TELE
FISTFTRFTQDTKVWFLPRKNVATFPISRASELASSFTSGLPLSACVFTRWRRQLLEHTWPLHRAVTQIGLQKRTPDQKPSNMDQVMQFVEPSRQFVKDSIRLVKRCTKPDRKEFSKIAMATAIGFAIMGFIGFFVKLIHIPINNIIVGG